MSEKPRTYFQFAPAPVGVIADTSLSAADLRTLLAISSYDRFGGSGNGNGAGCYASQSRIAGDIGSSREQVNRSIKKLTEAGYLGVKRSAGRDQRRIYYVIFEPVTKRSQEGVRESSQGVPNSSQETGHRCDETINREPVDSSESDRPNNDIERAGANPIYSAKQEYISQSEDISLSEKRYTAKAAPAPSRKRDASGAAPRRNYGGEIARLERETRSQGAAITADHVRRSARLVMELHDCEGESRNVVAKANRVHTEISERYEELHGGDALADAMRPVLEALEATL